MGGGSSEDINEIKQNTFNLNNSINSLISSKNSIYSSLNSLISSKNSIYSSINSLTHLISYSHASQQFYDYSGNLLASQYNAKSNMKIQYPPVFRASLTTCLDVSVSARTVSYCSFSNCNNINLNCDIMSYCTITKTLDTTNTNNESFYYITANKSVYNNIIEGLGKIKITCNNFSTNTIRNVEYLDLDANIVSNNEFTFTMLDYVSNGSNSMSTFYISHLDCKCHSIYNNTFRFIHYLNLNCYNFASNSFENINCLSLNCYSISEVWRVYNYSNITKLHINCNILSSMSFSSIKELCITCDSIISMGLSSCLMCNIIAPRLRYCYFTTCSILNINCAVYYDNSMFNISIVRQTVSDAEDNTFITITHFNLVGHYVSNMSFNSIHWLEFTAYETRNITHDNVTSYRTSTIGH